MLYTRLALTRQVYKYAVPYQLLLQQSDTAKSTWEGSEDPTQGGIWLSGLPVEATEVDVHALLSSLIGDNCTEWSLQWPECGGYVQLQLPRDEVSSGKCVTESEETGLSGGRSAVSGQR